MTLHGQVTARLDSLERQAQRALSWTGRIHGWRGRNVEIDAQWTVDVWAPSLRRRAERHEPVDLGRVEHCCQWCCHPEGCAPWPCPDFRDLCVELGINLKATT
jgi:hypothetical protein